MAPKKLTQDNTYKIDIQTVRDWLRNFAEDPEIQKQMSKAVYDLIWAEIQSIDYELQSQTK